MNAKQQLIALIERVVPDNTPVCRATFKFQGYWDEIEYGALAPSGVITQVEVEHLGGLPTISITTNNLFGRPG